MEFKVFGEDKHHKEVFFRLRNKGRQEITLIACDHTGTPLPAGNILTITHSGIRIHSFLNPGIGIPLNADGEALLLRDELRG